MKDVMKKEETSDDESGLGYQNTLVSFRNNESYFLFYRKVHLTRHIVIISSYHTFYLV